MAVTFLLVRHATHPLVGRVLCGRMGGVELDPEGIRQAENLSAAVGTEHPTALYTSPRRRCERTADILGRRWQMRPHLLDALDEIDFGTWTGCHFAKLADDPQWSLWNEQRSQTCPPGGESMTQAQTRVVSCLQQLHSRHGDSVVALVSHADIIKAAIMWCLGLSLDAHDRIEIQPASVSRITLWDGGGKVLSVNERAVA